MKESKVYATAQSESKAVDAAPALAQGQLPSQPLSSEGPLRSDGRKMV